PPAQTATPVLADPADLGAAVPAPLAGTGVAGAAVSLLDEAGTTLATTTADADGRFSATIPGDLLHAGMTVRAVQTAAGLRASEPSAAVGPFVLPTPTVTGATGSLDAPLQDADFDGRDDDLYLLLSGQRGQTVAVSVDGAWTGNLHTLTGQPLQRVVYDMAPGDHVIGIRCVDPASGREGRVSFVTIRALPR
ncbi:Ig-like domain-containing protein, partial [Microbacterium arthrosphaerae]